MPALTAKVDSVETFLVGVSRRRDVVRGIVRLLVGRANHATTGQRGGHQCCLCEWPGGAGGAHGLLLGQGGGRHSPDRGSGQRVGVPPRPCQAVAPSVFPTDLVVAALNAGAASLDGYVDRTPARRLGDLEVLADVFLYLASDQSSYVTGQTLRVDGGWVSGHYL